MKFLALFLFKILGIFASILPLPLFLFFGRGIGWLLYLISFRKKIMMDNIQLAFPEKTEIEVKDLIFKNYMHYGITLLEFFHSFHNFEKFLSDRCDLEGVENIRLANEQGKGVFVITGHLGNWELLTIYGSDRVNLDVTMVTKRLKPAWLHNYIEKSRAVFGVRLACEPNTMRHILKRLKVNGVVGMAIDQYAGAPVGARVKFFGVAVGTNTATCTLALRTGAKVVPSFAIRKPDGRYRIIFEPAIEMLKSDQLDESSAYKSKKEKDIVENTALITQNFEKWVRQYPEQWLWIHRRWKGDLSPLPEGLKGELL